MLLQCLLVLKLSYSTNNVAKHFTHRQLHSDFAFTLQSIGHHSSGGWAESLRAAALVASVSDFFGITDGLADSLKLEADAMGIAIDDLANDIVNTFTDAFNGMESKRFP